MRSKLYWASVGGNKTEPIRVVKEGGKEQFYSIGCNDPHDMEGVELLGPVTDMPMSRRSEAAQVAAEARWNAHRQATGPRGYRKFD